MALTQITDGIWEGEGVVSPGPGMRMGTRMTVVRKPNGGLWIHSPIELDDSTASEIEALGPVEEIVSPNLFHHLFLKGALERWPDAVFFASEGLAAKRPDLPSARTLEPGEDWLGCFDVLALGGMPRFQEHVFFHKPSRTLIVTDLIFNEPAGHTAATRLFFRVFGTYGRLSVSRLFRSIIRDKAAFGASLRPVLEIDADRVVMAHGKVLEENAAQRFRELLSPFAA